MDLSPEEKRRIYEEEKARIEAEQKQQEAAGGSTTGLEPNIAGFLCYLGGWITGIIFLIIEQENRFVRFHALQSIVVFGSLTIIGTFFRWIPIFGTVFSTIIGILAFILWILLMVKAYQGELYKVPVASQIVEGILPSLRHDKKPETDREQKSSEPAHAEELPVPPAQGEAKPPVIAEKMEEFGNRMESYFTGTRAGRITGYSAVIFWNVVLLIFFSFFHRYIAWYHIEPDGGVTRMSVLTGDYFIWLPVLVTALIISIAANILLVIYDRYWMREIIQTILTVIGVVVVVNLVSIFPFDFSTIPNVTAADIMPEAVTIVLILTAVGLGVGSLVRFIKLIVNIARGSTG